MNEKNQPLDHGCWLKCVKPDYSESSVAFHQCQHSTVP